MRKRQYQIDMCSGPLWNKLLLFALPLIASSMLQLLFNAADVVVVGWFAGKEALAAVGSNTSLINLLVNLFIGLSVGTNVVVARDLGAGRHDNVSRSVHTSITLALISGVIMTIFGEVMVRKLLMWMSSPTDVIDLSTIYLRIYFFGMPANLLYNFSAAILRAQGDTQRPLYFLTIAGVRFSNPVIAASGTFGYGTEYASVTAVQKLGGICSKGLTLEPRPGNQGVRLKETPSGLINSIGLENPGIPHFIEKELPTMLSLGPVTIANLSGSSIETYTQGAALLEKTAVPMIELNISCPNVKAGGMAFGLHCEDAAMVTSAVKKAAPSKPLIVKLSPNAPDLIAVAEAVRKAGADALSLINTVQAISIDIEKGKPLFNNIRAGLSGPAVKPLALRLVYDLIQHMNTLPESQRIPVIALGGIATWQDAVEFIMAGAHAIQVGTATFANPTAMTEIILGLEEFMKRKGFRTLQDFRGCAQV